MLIMGIKKISNKKNKTHCNIFSLFASPLIFIVKIFFIPAVHSVLLPHPNHNKADTTFSHPFRKKIKQEVF